MGFGDTEVINRGISGMAVTYFILQNFNKH